MSFPLASSKIFSLFLVFKSFIIVDFDVYFFEFILLGISLAPWISSFVPFGKFSIVISSNFLLTPISFSEWKSD
jgi:hypothetical protein